MTKRAGVALLGLAFALGASAASGDDFERLKTIAGAWQGSAANGKPLHVEYKVISGGSVLLQSWQPGTRGETATMFHRDGDHVLATHYCAQGNQPRLAMHRDGDAFVFEYVDATNLVDPAASHMRRLVVAPQKDGTLELMETYRGRGRDETDRVRLHRSDAAAH